MTKNVSEARWTLSPKGLLMPVRRSPERRSRRTWGQSPEVAYCLEDVSSALRGRRKKQQRKGGHDQAPSATTKQLEVAEDEDEDTITATK